MSDMTWEHASEARAALNAIVTDPEHGVGALSNASTMSNLLKDYLPDAPREKSILVAAAEAGLADTLREHVAQGMDPNTAIRLTASSFSSSTPFTPEACNWVTDEIAVALGISQPRTGREGAFGGAGGGAFGGAPAAFAPTGNQAAPTQMGPTPAPGQGAPGGYSPAQGQAAPSAPGGAGAPGAPAGQGYPQAPAQGFGSPAQPGPQDQPTAQGYRPGFGPQPGGVDQVPGQVPGQAYPGQPAQGFQGQRYPGQPAQGFQGQRYPGQPAQGFQGQGFQGQGYPAQPRPYQAQPGSGFPGQPGFAQPGQPGTPGGWQPGGYGPGFGGQPKPSGGRRGLLVGGGILLVIILGVVAALTLSHSPKNNANGHHTTPPTSPTSTPTTSTSPTTGGVESLKTIMNPAGLTPVGTECVQALLFGLKASTLTSRTFCAKTTYKNIDVWGYQFDNHADYQAGVAHINSYTGFQQTSNSCPPAAGSDAGSIGWHANSNPKYASRPGQVIECFADHNKPVLIWTMPTMNVFFIAQDTGTGDTIPRIVTWWRTVNYG